MTSKRLTAVADYLRLLLTTSAEQARSLLLSITTIQVQALSEIAHNLLRSTLPSKFKKTVAKYKTLLQKLGKKSGSIKIKIKLVKKHLRQVLNVLLSMKDSLMKLI